MERIKKWFLGCVPKYVSAKVILSIFSFLAAINHISNQKIREHLEQNSRAWENYQKKHSGEKYIEHQAELKEIRYGKQNRLFSSLFLGGKSLNGAANTCEVIAVYNALTDCRGEEVRNLFPELLAYFEKEGIMLSGYFGTAPSKLEKYIKRKHYETKTLSGKKINTAALESISKEYKTFIMTVFNDRENIMEQVHTMCITAREGHYVIHNDYEGSRKYASLEKAIYGYRNGKGKPISIMGIR